LKKTRLVRACLLQPAGADVGSAANANVPQVYIATGDGRCRQLATNQSAADTCQEDLTAAAAQLRAQSGNS